MAVDIKSLIRDLDAETAPLQRLLVGISARDWDEPTPAHDWTVRDQVTHLAYFDQVAVTSATAPSDFEAEVAAALPNVDAYTARIALRYSYMSGTDVLTWFGRARARLTQAFASLDPSKKVPWFGPAMSPASSITARIMETWAHGQDIYDAVGSAHPTSPAIRHVAHLGVRTLPHSFLANGLEVPTVGMRVELEPPAGLSEAGWSWGPEDAADRVTGPALDFCLVVTQRRHVDDTALVAAGPAAARWLGIAQAFAGPPGEGRRPGQFR